MYLTKYHYFSIHIILYSQFCINVHKKCTWPRIIISISTFTFNFGSKYKRSVLDLVLPSCTVDFGWFVAFGEHQNFPCLKLIEIVILWVYYTIPFGFSLFWHFLVITFQLFILHVWLRITEEGSVPEMRIRSISLIYSDLKMVYTSE